MSKLQNKIHIRELLFSWPIANLLGFGLGVLSMIVLIFLAGGWGLPSLGLVETNDVLKIQQSFGMFLFGAVFGLLVGLAQTVAINEFLEQAWLWVISTIVGYGVGFLLASFFLAFPLVALSASAFLSSTFQWFIYRHQMVYEKAIYWIYANLALGIFVGLVIVFIPSFPLNIFLSIFAWVLGNIFVGMLLSWLIGKKSDDVGVGENA